MTISGLRAFLHFETLGQHAQGGTAVEKATFGAGCFWQVEAAFRRLGGVRSTSVGYLGGSLENPSYEQVRTGETGHVEAVEVEFDPAAVSYEELLSTFWEIHDPTTPNRQGPDVGTQYQSAIFCHSAEQQSAAIRSREILQSRLKRRVVTEVAPASQFHRAQERHQHYLEKQEAGAGRT